MHTVTVLGRRIDLTSSSIPGEDVLDGDHFGQASDPAQSNLRQLGHILQAKRSIRQTHILQAKRKNTPNTTTLTTKQCYTLGASSKHAFNEVFNSFCE
jgi:hypothetical protein